MDQSNQRPGLFGRIGNFFGAGDPNAGQPTDPFAGLSRAQRTMLGFSALKDAAASLEGRDTNYFNEALGGFEAARERERLREQGIFQNQVGALQALAQIEQQIAIAQEFGLPVSPAMTQMRDMLTASVTQGGGMPAGGAVPPMQPPSNFTGGVVPQGLPSGPQGVTSAPQTGVVYDSAGTVQPQPYTGEAEVVQTGGVPAAPVAQPAAPTDPIAAIDAELANIEGQIEAIIQGQPTGADVTVGAIAGIPVGDDPQAQARLARLQEQEARLLAQREAAIEAQTAEQREAQQAETQRSRMEPLINDALGFLVDPRGNIRDTTAMIASRSGFGAGLMPGVTAAQARLARDAVTELGAIAAMGSIREAREAGFGGALSDADILLIQRSGGIFDLSRPEATARTLQRLQEDLGLQQSNDDGGDGFQTVTMPDGTQVRIRVRD